MEKFMDIHDNLCSKPSAKRNNLIFMVSIPSKPYCEAYEKVRTLHQNSDYVQFKRNQQV